MGKKANKRSDRAANPALDATSEPEVLATRAADPAELAPDDPEGLFSESPEPARGLADVANRTIRTLLSLTSRDESAADVVDRLRPDELDPHDSGPVTEDIPVVALSSTALVRGHLPDTHRTVALMAKVDDRPGALGELLATLHAHDVELRTVLGLPGDNNDQRLELVVSAPAQLTNDELAQLVAGMTREVRIRPWSNPRVEDMITSILDLAASVVNHPDLLDDMLVTLMSAQSAEHTTPLSGADDSRSVMRVQLTPEDHLVLRRPWAEFEPLDRQRASALLRLAAAARRARGDSSGRLFRIKNGEQLWFRLARPEDADRLAAMHDRTSADSLYRRYHGAAELGGVALRHLTGGHRGATIVAMNRDGLLVGVGHVFPLDDETAEMAMLVEDAYQNKGVGAELLAEQLRIADELGFTMVRADVLGQNAPMLTLLERTGLQWKKQVENGVVEHVARLDGRQFEAI